MAAGTVAVAAGLGLRSPSSVTALTLLEIIGLLIVLSACALVVFQFARRADPRRSVADIADLLAAAALRQWATEARIRRLNDPYPLPVSWEAVPGQDAAWERLRAAVQDWPASSRPEPAQWAIRAEDLAGRGEDLAQRLLDQIPSRRILLLGGAGAGKSILMVRLTLSLLRGRRPGDPVPVLVPLSSWNPKEQELRSWLRDRLSIDYPTLVESGSGGTHADSGFDALLDTRKMILLLDGLDEIQPAALRSAAVKRMTQELNRATYSWSPAEQKTARQPSQERASSGTLLRSYSTTWMLLRSGAISARMREPPPRSGGRGFSRHGRIRPSPRSCGRRSWCR